MPLSRSPLFAMQAFYVLQKFVARLIVFAAILIVDPFNDFTSLIN